MIKHVKHTKVTKDFCAIVLGELVNLSVEKEVILRFDTESGGFSKLTSYQVHSEETLIAYRVYEWKEGSEERKISSFGSPEIMVEAYKAL